jgi:mRNA interferase MazF
MNDGLILRGRIYAVGDRYYLVVSNDPRNGQLPDVLAVRLTATAVPTTPSIVEIPEGEPFVGHVLCDYVETVSAGDIVCDLGALSPATMRAVCGGLRAALAL